jgi:hypothetical protein
MYRRGGARWCRSHRVRTGLHPRESGIRKISLWERWHNSDKRSHRKRKKRCCHRLLGRLGPLASSRSICLQAVSPNGDRSFLLLEKRQPPSLEGSPENNTFRDEAEISRTPPTACGPPGRGVSDRFEILNSNPDRLRLLICGYIFAFVQRRGPHEIRVVFGKAVVAFPHPDARDHISDTDDAKIPIFLLPGHAPQTGENHSGKKGVIRLIKKMQTGTLQSQSGFFRLRQIAFLVRQLVGLSITCA